MKISNCPYCKDDSVDVDYIELDQKQVSCNSCGMAGPLMETDAEAIEAWEQLCSLLSCGRRPVPVGEIIKEMTNQYIPDYIVTPGDVLKEYLDAFGISQVELSEATGITKTTIRKIIKGEASITKAVAIKLEKALERPAHFWMNLEKQYQEDKLRLGDNNG